MTMIPLSGSLWMGRLSSKFTLLLLAFGAVSFIFGDFSEDSFLLED